MLTRNNKPLPNWYHWIGKHSILISTTLIWQLCTRIRQTWYPHQLIYLVVCVYRMMD